MKINDALTKIEAAREKALMSFEQMAIINPHDDLLKKIVENDGVIVGQQRIINCDSQACQHLSHDEDYTLVVVGVKPDWVIRDDQIERVRDLYFLNSYEMPLLMFPQEETGPRIAVKYERGDTGRFSYARLLCWQRVCDKFTGLK